ncbi:alpha-E domain-containing protein [Sulfurirhabdus autotrophica]|uniref:Putative alpha-E superfamily protein n=1 Tax=Sulfurirhabdus autotrophica TaxID=1706046 RepID=A0A4R3YHB9_9PROT|nr:alpha-E domain-containing protein [Sulfurirhabdus autotrophica]TCV90658.1 putative alpha-E superfamily protein [Sulfurirhabdus autotrophica]
MLSRVANSIYWMSRYLERAENVARFIEVNLNLSLDMPSEFGEQWAPLVNITGDHAEFSKRYSEPTRENVMHFLTFDRENPNSIFSCVRNARENARSVREIISSEMWEQANRFYLLVKDAATNKAVTKNPHDFYTAVKMASHLFDGITEATMSHGEAWHFLQVGELLERADKTSRILDVKYFILLPDVSSLGTTIDNIQWAALLKSASALEMYRKHFKQINPSKVADFLILNREFPRSVHSCLDRTADSLHAITGSPLDAFSNKAEQRLGRLLGELNYTQIDEIITGGLHDFLDGLQTRLNQIDDGIFETFFALRTVTNGNPHYQTQSQMQ